MIQMFPITSEDAPLLAHVHAMSGSLPWTTSEFLPLLQNPFSKGWIARAEGEAIGFIMVSLIPPEAEILNLAVVKEWWGKSVGQKLLRYFLVTCHNYIKSVFLEVDCKNRPALHIYQKEGFYQVGKRPNYYPYPSGNFSDALILRRETPSLFSSFPS